MLRGIAGVAAPGEIVTGSFYLQPHYADGSWIFLRVQLPQNSSPDPAWDMIFDRQDRHGIFFEEPRGIEPVAAIQPVSVRIDRTSKLETSHSSMVRPGILSVVGQDVFVTAQLGRGPGRLTVNLCTGEAVGPSPPSGWMSFSKWSLVVDDGDEEITLVSYDTHPAS